MAAPVAPIAPMPSPLQPIREADQLPLFTLQSESAITCSVVTTCIDDNLEGLSL